MQSLAGGLRTKKQVIVPLSAILAPRSSQPLLSFLSTFCAKEPKLFCTGCRLFKKWLVSWVTQVLLPMFQDPLTFQIWKEVSGWDRWEWLFIHDQFTNLLNVNKKRLISIPSPVHPVHLFPYLLHTICNHTYYSWGDCIYLQKIWFKHVQDFFSVIILWLCNYLSKQVTATWIKHVTFSQIAIWNLPINVSNLWHVIKKKIIINISVYWEDILPQHNIFPVYTSQIWLTK